MKINKNKIRIFFLIDTIESDRAGTEKQLLRLAEGLPANRYQCYLWCFRDSAWLRANEMKMPVFIGGSSSLRSWQFYVGMYRLIALLKKEKIDIVQAHFPLSITAGVIAAHLAGVRRIVSCRRDMGFWYTRIMLLVLRFANRWVARFFVNSQEIKRFICKKEDVHLYKIGVIRNGIDPPPELDKSEISQFRQLYAIPDGALIVGIVSNMNRPVKRLDVFIKAASIILKNNIDTYFFVIGEGKYSADLRNMTRELGIDKNIKFLGSQPYPMGIIPCFDICVNTSDSEGFSNSVLEYMTCGKPVVATRVGGNIEAVDDGINGFLFPPGDEIVLAQKISLLILNNELRRRLGENARRKASQFTYTNMFSEYELEYENLIKGY
jgi:glycosyltransferase involved in cell wall biosynthesis